MRAAAALVGSWIENKRQNGSKFCGPGLLRWASQPVLNFELADHAGGSVTRRVLGMKTRDNMCLNMWSGADLLVRWASQTCLES